MAGCVQLDVRGPRTYPARSVEARRAGANGPEAGAGERSRRTGKGRTGEGRTGESRTCQGVAGEACTSEGAACEETCAAEGSACKETRAAETAASEACAPKRGTGKADPASASRPCEGRFVRANGTLPRGYCD